MRSTYDDFLREVRAYEEHFRPPTLPSFDVAPPYDLFPERAVGSFSCKTKWPDSYAYPLRAGVYAFFSEDAKLLYVGKASFRHSISARLATYCGYQEGRGGPCRLLHQWKNAPRYVVVVAVPEGSPFEAPALEEFLISKLSPPENSVGIDRSRSA